MKDTNEELKLSKVTLTRLLTHSVFSPEKIDAVEHVDIEFTNGQTLNLTFERTNLEPNIPHVQIQYPNIELSDTDNKAWNRVRLKEYARKLYNKLKGDYS